MGESLTRKIKKILKYDYLFGSTVFKYYIKKHLSNEKLLRISVSDLKHDIFIRKNTSDFDVFEQVICKNEYYFDYPIEPKIIIDCGANIGMASVYFKTRYPNARIIALEPEAENFEILLKNTERYENIECLQCGIWNKNTYLKIKNFGCEEWGYITEETTIEDTETIKAISIKQLIKEYNLNTIDILKIDIEGAEKELFEQDVDDWLPFVKMIIIELHDNIKKDATKTFFKAIEHMNYRMRVYGEYLFCFFDEEDD